MVRYVFNAVDTGDRNHPWVTDGTAGGTSKLSDVATDYSLAVRYPYQVPTSYGSLGNGYAVFFATDAATGTELWVTDGTAAGTRLVKDINPGSTANGPNSSTPTGITPLGNGRALFAAADGVTGQELWTTDGTPNGTYEVRDINPGAAGSSPYGFAPLGNGTVLFSANDGATGSELWATDGTAGGTRLVADINPATVAGSGPASSSPYGITPVGNGRALFSANDGSTGTELWATDGTAAGTRLVKDINPGSTAYGPNSSTPTGVTPLGDGRVVFNAYDADAGTEPWISDGTADGTRRLKDIYPGSGTYGPNSSFPNGFTPLGNGRFVFAANDGASGTEPWVSDGTAAGTVLLKDINPVVGALVPGFPDSSYPYGFTVIGGGRALFSASSLLGNELWITDGTADGTRLVKDIFPGGTSTTSFGSAPNGFVATGTGGALFDALDGATGAELWTTDGTEAGTSLVRDVNPGRSGSNPNSLAALRLIRGAAGTDPLFDPVYYTTRNPDVGASGLDPFQHYLQYGYREARNPDPYFDTQYYLDRNPDVAAAAANGLNPLLHWEQDGYREGRNPSAAFDVRQYLAVNQDVAGAGLDPLRHYLADGRVEGRIAYAVPGAIPGPLVDMGYYYAANPDVAASGIAAAEHYVTWGWHEGRNPDAYFDTGYYLSRNADVTASGMNPLEHYDRYGWREGRDPSAQFSTGKYLAAYGDVRAAGVDPLLHFLQYGQGEGRQAFPA